MAMIKAMFKQKRFRNKKCSFNWTMYIKYVALYFFDIRNFEYTELPFLDVRKILLYYIKYRLLHCRYILIKKKFCLSGKLVLGKVIGIAHRRPRGEQLDQANPVRNDETGLWQCPFCNRSDFPELSEVQLIPGNLL